MCHLYNLLSSNLPHSITHVQPYPACMRQFHFFLSVRTKSSTYGQFGPLRCLLLFSVLSYRSYDFYFTFSSFPDHQIRSFFTIRYYYNCILLLIVIRCVFFLLSVCVIIYSSIFMMYMLYMVTFLIF